MDDIVIYEKYENHLCDHCGYGSESVVVRLQICMCTKCNNNNVTCKINYEGVECLTPRGNDTFSVEKNISILDNDDWKSNIEEVLPKYYTEDVIDKIIDKLTELNKLTYENTNESDGE